MALFSLTSPRASWVRKIPGTTYSQPRPASDHASAATHSASSLTGWEQESAGDGSADPDVQSHDGASFGQEQHTSREARGACVPVLDQERPFFQTKLSTSPSIIAFVRLEMCSAAGEIIEGGCTERVTREGDQASNQLCIAQAALLSLRGNELHSRPPIGAASTHIDDFLPVLMCSCQCARRRMNKAPA
ncbi:hypothetical protein B0H19DRAFT_1077051 [Mycena capillaripes]|nr:hypothetical protein B0H19DRAFT_1077051 [Mycena capillaripes]